MSANNASNNGDDHGASHGVPAITATGPRSSPYDPPEKDIFVTDAGPGLDTGCTFNTSPEHPLTIDVMIDRAVGPVDANGYLVDPTPLITNGLIPSTVEILMPAYDIDVYGGPPPEQDAVAFNGENIGLLTGDDGVWKLNSFSVPISKVKFPVPPPPGTSPIPQANRIVITIDTLSSGNWCTAIDWVGLIIPIKPKLALTLEPVAGASNKIRENNSSATIDVIYKETADAGCSITQVIGPIDQYPFSGSSESGWGSLFSGEAQITSKIEPCPVGSLLSPEVELKWSIAGTSLEGTETWSGLEGVATITMPKLVGAYDVTFDYKVDDEALPTVTRKLFVTKRPPSIAPIPRLSWYKHGTSWASGLSSETDILRNLLSGLYGYGQTHWWYGYDFGAVGKCTWENLAAANPIPCNYSDCYVFSEVFENIAGTLGIGGLVGHSVFGAHGVGFVTTGSPSLDSNFKGNARPFTSPPFAALPYDRYRFSSHSLRVRGGSYYDATFNGIYSSDTQFILWNFDGNRNVDADGPYYTTDEGAKVYRILGVNAYDSWGAHQYKAAVPPAPVRPSSMSQNVGIPGTASYTPVDSDGNGVYEALVANVDIDIVTPGTYLVEGVLQKNGKVVATQPSFEVAKATEITIQAAQAGSFTATLPFSGEQIYQSGEDGPYELEVLAFSSISVAASTLTTPAYNHVQFGERSGRITNASDSTSDTDSDGRYDYLVIDVQTNILGAGTYTLQGTLLKDGSTIVNASETFLVGAGTQTLSLKFPGVSIFRSGQDGPYEAIIGLFDTSGQRQGDIAFLTQAHSHGQFEGILDLTGAFNDQGIDNNGNGLYDLLRVDFGADVRTAGTFLVTAALRNLAGPLTVYSEVLMNLSAGSQTITVNFSGPEINSQAIDGPYAIDVSLRDPNTHNELDRVALGQQTAPYSHMDFEPLGGSPGSITLSGNSTDQGIDNNSNGLYDLLKVSVEVKLAISDFYVWSARLVDDKGIEIGFDSRSGSLNAGTSNIEFGFDGNLIGQNGVSGPYFVKGLLMSGQTGPSLVATQVAETQAYSANQFEGYVPPNGDVNGDGAVNALDVVAVMNDFLGLQNWPAADVNGDGVVNALDVVFVINRVLGL